MTAPSRIFCNKLGLRGRLRSKLGKREGLQGGPGSGSLSCGVVREGPAGPPCLTRSSPPRPSQPSAGRGSGHPGGRRPQQPSTQGRRAAPRTGGQASSDSLQSGGPAPPRSICPRPGVSPGGSPRTIGQGRLCLREFLERSLGSSSPPWDGSGWGCSWSLGCQGVCQSWWCPLLWELLENAPGSRSPPVARDAGQARVTLSGLRELGDMSDSRLQPCQAL